MCCRVRVRCEYDAGGMLKALAAITAVGLGAIGFAIWVYVASAAGFVSPPGSHGGGGMPTCASSSSRSCVRISRDGAVWLVQSNGRVVQLEAGHG